MLFIQVLEMDLWCSLHNNIIYLLPLNYTCENGDTVNSMLCILHRKFKPLGVELVSQILCKALMTTTTQR